MITRWKIENFKSVRNKADLEIGPLTVFVGPNSSGKSSFVQTMLLVAQTLDQTQIASQSVILNGALVNLGHFKDIKSDNIKSEEINISCTCRPLKDQMTRRSGSYFDYDPLWIRFSEITCDISLAYPNLGSADDITTVHPRLVSSQLSCKFNEVSEHSLRLDIRKNLFREQKNVNHKNSEEANILVKNFTKFSKKYKNKIDRYRDVVACSVNLDEKSQNDLETEHFTAEPIGCIMRHFVPEWILCDIDQNKESAKNIASFMFRSNFGFPYKIYSPHRVEYDFNVYSNEIIETLQEILKDQVNTKNIFERRKSLLESLNDMLPDELKCIRSALDDIGSDKFYDLVYSKIRRLPKGRKRPISQMPIFLPPAIGCAYRCLGDHFSSSFRYLGPLRDAPKSLYPMSPVADPRDVGLRGENTASVIDLCKDIKVDYIHPSCFRDEVIRAKVTSRTLERALSDWLQYLNVAKAVTSVNKGKQGYEMKVTLLHSDSMRELNSVGVGVSQVLPILVMGLLAFPDTTLVFEQPELHLHPTVQSLLADFFISMTLCNKQCIIESHSEHLVDQLLFRKEIMLKDTETAEISARTLTKIYSVRNTRDTSTFDELKFDKHGNVSTWPRGFFELPRRSMSRFQKIYH